jgi:hypothetical protein
MAITFRSAQIADTPEMAGAGRSQTAAVLSFEAEMSSEGELCFDSHARE